MAKHSITTKSSRMKLPVRRDPYWHMIEKGRHLGFRRGPNTWVARFMDIERDYHFKALGSFDEFTDAKKDAEQWFAAMSGAPSSVVARGTVRCVLASYIQDLRDQNRIDAAKAAKKMLGPVFADEKFCGVQFEDLTADQFKAFRRRLEISSLPMNQKSPAEKLAALQRYVRGERASDICESMNIRRQAFYDWRVCKISAKKSGTRAPQTINRLIRQVKAGLNYGLKAGYAGKPNAWAVGKLFEGNRTEAVFLSPAQRARLIKYSPQEVRDFLLALDFSGARPGEIARAVAGDFDVATGKLKLQSKKGHGGEWRVRHVSLSPQGVEFFGRIHKGKLPMAPLLISPRGQHWTHSEWARRIGSGVEMANIGISTSSALYIPDNTSAYAFRHSFISEALLVMDPMAVGKLTGTSVQMMEATYHHLIRDSVQQALKEIDARRMA